MISSPPKINYLDLPKTRWMSKASFDEYLDGNAIRISPFDKDVLYATNRAGALRVKSAVNGNSITTVSPSPRTLTENGSTQTWTMYSKSGMAFGSFRGTASEVDDVPEDDNNDDTQSYNDYLDFLLNNGINQNQEDEDTNQSHFVVYSIVDEAPAATRFLPKTRVVCVSIPEHKILWTSAGLPGTPNGSPLIYYADERTMSLHKETHGSYDTNEMYVVLTHNSHLIKPDNTTRITGHLTVLDPQTGHVKWTQSEWSRNEVPKGYGPPQVSHHPILGGANSGGYSHNKNDVIIWTSSGEEGKGNSGNLYAFQQKSLFELSLEATKSQNTTANEKVEPFEIRVLKKVRWNSIARPSTNRNGTNLYVGVTGNAVRGWNGNAKFNETANWANRLVSFDNGPDTLAQTIQEVAISTAPVLSADEERLFATTIRNETVCLDAKSGVRLWGAKTRKSSSLLSEPKASPDNERLYIITSKNGEVQGLSQKDGEILWRFGCNEKNLSPGSDCGTPSISADFDLSADGTILYFGASDGRVVALTLGEQASEVKNVVDKDTGKNEEPQLYPTVTIDLDDDSRGPLEFDESGELDKKTHSKHGSAMSKNNGKLGVKIVGTAIAIVVSLAVMLISIMYVMRAKGIDIRNYRLPRHKGKGKRHSYVTRLNGSDSYGDRIIASLSEDEKSMEEEFAVLWVDPTHTNPKHTINEDDESATESTSADRLSTLFGTSNRIAPVNDNFGYGQAVLI